MPQEMNPPFTPLPKPTFMGIFLFPAQPVESFFILAFFPNKALGSYLEVWVLIRLREAVANNAEEELK